MKIPMILDYLDSGHMARPASQCGHVQSEGVRLNGQAEIIAIASQVGGRCFTSIAEVTRDVLAEDLADEVAA